MIKKRAVLHDILGVNIGYQNLGLHSIKQEISNTTRCLETGFYLLTSREICVLLGYYAAISGKKLPLLAA